MNSAKVVYDVNDLQNRIVSKSKLTPEEEYQQTHSREKLELLVDYFLSDFQYEKAGNYFKDIIDFGDDRDRATMMKIGINDLNPWVDHYSKLQWLLSGYYASGVIDNDDYLFYSFTLDLLQNKFDKNDINSLTWHYTQFKNQLRSQFDTYYNYKDAPEYYLLGLFSITYFKHQDFGVAKQLATLAIQKNPNYILPYQVKAYVGLLTRDYENALEPLNTLIQIDSDAIERYQFLLWLMYYNQNDGTKAENYFLQMKSPRLRVEGLRYLVDLERTKQIQKTTGTILSDLNSISVEDKNIVRYMEELFLSDSVWHLQTIDFQTVFDRYIFDRLGIGSGATLGAQKLYLTYPEVLDRALEICPELLTGNLFVCHYGQGAKLLLEGKRNESMKMLIPLVKKYPNRQIYYMIWVAYKEQGLLDNAKLYFGKALQYADSPQKKPLSAMMLELLNKESP